MCGGCGAGVTEEDKVAGKGSVASACVLGSLPIAPFLKLSNPSGTTDLTPDVFAVARVVTAPVCRTRTDGIYLGLAQTPSNEHSAPRSARAAVAYAPVAHVVVVLGIVVRATGRSGIVSCATALLISKLGESNGKNVGTVIARVGKTCKIGVIFSAFIGRGNRIYTVYIRNVCGGSRHNERRYDHKDRKCDGEDSLKKLASRPNAIGFIFDGMQKSELFEAVNADGSLPRKTFSMGHADDKRFYIEARKIK